MIRIKRRRAQRGAAMVEGIVVMGTMLVFLGMNLWAAKAFGGKLDQATAVRRDVMFYATHNCEKNNDEDPDTYVDPALKGSGGAAGDGGFAQDLKLLVSTIAASKSGQDAGLASGTKGDKYISGSAIVNMGRSRATMTARLKTSSTVACNEKAIYEENKFLTLIEAGWDFFKGIKSLIK